MSIFCCNRSSSVLHFALEKKKSDEQIVREALIEEWKKILEHYATAGVTIPPENEVREELLNAGVEAAIHALLHEHWWMRRFMIEGKIHKKVKEGLDVFNLPGFIQEVKEAQKNPALLPSLQKRIEDYVMNF